MTFKKSEHKEKIDQLIATFKTNIGNFEVKLYAKECPETVWNFVNLAEGRTDTQRKKEFYNDLIFHRVIKGFVIQTGCPLGNGTGGPGYKFKDEFNSSLNHDSPGVVSMANSGPDTNGSQFFITLAATPHLDNHHTVFGKVIKGLEVIMNIGSVPVDSMDKPINSISIEEVKISR